MKLGVAAYPLEWHRSLAALAAKRRAWVAEAAMAGAELLVFPEYAEVEAALITGAAPDDWSAAAAVADDPVPWRALAAEFEVHILAGSGPVALSRGVVNRARLFAPNGATGHQDKQILTPWERRHTPLVPGEGLTVFDTALGRIAVLVCYDAEFPALAKAHPADLLLIPACTDTPAGQTRVHLAARARALEGQCITAHAALVGDVPGCALVDTNHGAGGIFAPPDTGYPADGVLAQGAMNVPGWTFADIDVAAVSRLRESGDVALRADWSRQFNRPLRGQTLMTA